MCKLKVIAYTRFSNVIANLIIGVSELYVLAWHIKAS